MVQKLLINQNFSLQNNHIPLPSSPIFGRDKEIKALKTLLEKHPVVTITGTGGVGKTRISFELCQQLKQDYQDGIVFVSMATLTDSREVMPALANALGITESASRYLAEGVADILFNKNVLLVLDNLEHVISAANEISDLVSQCPKVKILCTSRTPLKISAEQEYVLPTLLLPPKLDFKSLMKYPSINLFVYLVQKVTKDFELTPENGNTIIKICRKLDCLPLALELAAARLRVLSLEQLLKRLSKTLNILTTGSKDFPTRHQTLRATIEWSYALLNEPERKLFRRLAVFAKGFDLEAIESVCYDAEDERIEAIDEVETLLDTGLVERKDVNDRFTLLQTIKDFATEKLVASGELDLISLRHAQYFFEVSKIISEGTRGKRQKERMKLGILNESNIFAALDFLLEKSKQKSEVAQELGLSICGDLWTYWHIRGKHNTTKVYINSFLDATGDKKPSLGMCGALFSLHVACFTLGEVDKSREVAFRLFRTAEVLNNIIEETKGLFALGFGHMFIDLEKAIKYNDNTLTRFRKINDGYWIGLTLWQKGLFNLIGGNFVKAKESYTESLALFQKYNENEGIGCAQSGLAMLAFIEGNYNEATELYKGTLSAFEAVGDRPEQARILNEMSWTFLANNKTNTALKCAFDSIQAYQEVGSTRGIGLSLYSLAAIAAVTEKPEKAVVIASAAFQFAEQKGVAIELGANNHGKVYLENAKSGMSESAIEKAEKEGRSYSLKDVLQMVDREFNSANPSSMSHNHTFLKKLNDVIEANIDNAEFGVNQLYDAVSMSQMQVYRRLKATADLTPSQFIRRYRLQKGKELLKSTDKTISEIAYEVGFTDPNYFSRSFQKEYKTSPRAYRK
jgi:predicted ATPase/AraC-like DNA-binding protein